MDTLCAVPILILASLLCACETPTYEAMQTGKGQVPAYSREEFPHWSDLQPPRGCNTRSEVLARDVDSQGEKVASRNRNGCVTQVFILDPYIDTMTNNVDVDHIVALEDAWYSGAYKWSRTQREQFANDLSELIAVSASSNRSKGSKGPDTWRPPDARFRCTYALAYRDIKVKWSLTISQTQQDALTVLLARCV